MYCKYWGFKIKTKLEVESTLPRDHSTWSGHNSSLITNYFKSKETKQWFYKAGNFLFNSGLTIFYSTLNYSKG